MYIRKYIVSTIIFTIAAFIKVAAQEIKDDTIYASTKQQTTLYFPSGISICDYNDEAAYTRFNKRVESSMVSILAKTKDAAPAILKVKEGTRNHRFILAYKEELEPDEVDHDWEDLKALQKYVANRAAINKSNGTAVTVNNRQPAANDPGKPVSVTTGPAPSPTKPPTTTVTAKPIVESNEDYNSLLPKALTLFQNKKYAESRLLYEKASALRPDEKIARNKIAEIDVLLNNEQKDREYKEKIAAADKAFNAKNFEEAIGLYSLALSIKQNDAYAKRRLDESKRKLEDISLADKQRKDEEAFQQNMIAGKKAFEEKRYGDAKAAFSHAADLKPSDQLSRSQIKLIDNLIKSEEQRAEEAKLRTAKETAFSEALANGNDAFNNGNYDAALVEYRKAMAIKNDPYITEQIKKSNEGIALAKSKQASEQAAREKERLNLENYKKRLEKADEAFNLKKFAEAKALYKQALNYRDEQRPKDQLASIESTEARIAEESELKRKYNIAVSKGKSAIASNDLNKAKTYFEEAHTLRPDESFAKAQLDMVYGKLDFIAKQKELDDKYDTLLERGALAISNKEYKKAQDYYKEAGQLKPQEAHPTKMIVYLEGLLLEDIDRMKREEVARQRRQITTLQDQAVKAISERKWSEALAGYQQILSLNPLPADRDFASQKIVALQEEIKKSDSLNALKTPVAIKPKTKRERDQDKRDRLLAEANARKEKARLDTIAAQVERLKLLKGTNSIATAATSNASNANTSFLTASLQSEAIPYQHNDLVKKYPTINFDETPAGQTYDATDRKNRAQNFETSNRVISDTSNLNVFDSINYVKAICQNITFNGSNAFIKVLIKNHGTNDFLTGPIQLKVVKKNGNIINMNQRFISNYPIVMPKKEFPIVYVSNASEIQPTDTLVLEVTDRTKKTKLKINIPGSLYNMRKTAKL